MPTDMRALRPPLCVLIAIASRWRPSSPPSGRVLRMAQPAGVRGVVRSRGRSAGQAEQLPCAPAGCGRFARPRGCTRPQFVTRTRWRGTATSITPRRSGAAFWRRIAGLLQGGWIPALDGRREPRVRAAGAGRARGRCRTGWRARLIAPTSSRRGSVTQASASSTCASAPRRLRRDADDDRHPGRRLPQSLVALLLPLLALGRPSSHPGRGPLPDGEPTESAHFPTRVGRTFHPPPAASVSPKIARGGAKVGGNRQNVTSTGIC